MLEASGNMGPGHEARDDGLARGAVANSKTLGRVAQQVAQQTLTLTVGGSIPSSPAKS